MSEAKPDRQLEHKSRGSVSANRRSNALGHPLHRADEEKEPVDEHEEEEDAEEDEVRRVVLGRLRPASLPHAVDSQM